MLASRNTPPSNDVMLDIKIGIFLAGAVFGVVGMVRENRTLILIGIAILAVGMILRLVEGRRRRVAEDARADMEAGDEPGGPRSV